MVIWHHRGLRHQHGIQLVQTCWIIQASINYSCISKVWGRRATNDSQRSWTETDNVVVGWIVLFGHVLLFSKVPVERTTRKTMANCRTCWLIWALSQILVIILPLNCMIVTFSPKVIHELLNQDGEFTFLDARRSKLYRLKDPWSERHHCVSI